jgi:multicomponent Na+:H+ antiporter subunit G
MNWIVTIFLILGLVFFTGGCVGILRLPDFYTRLHAAGKLDTLGSLSVMLGLAVFCFLPLTLSALFTALKLMLIIVFIFISSPTATHSIVDAGLRAGLVPWTRERDGGTP